MRIRLWRAFRYQESARKERELLPGIYDVPGDISEYVAGMAIRYANASLIPKQVVRKKAPENKVLEVAENKTRVAKKAGRRRSTRSKSDK